jgi:hypothetical protein
VIIVICIFFKDFDYCDNMISDLTDDGDKRFFYCWNDVNSVMGIGRFGNAFEFEFGVDFWSFDALSKPPTKRPQRLIRVEKNHCLDFRGLLKFGASP